ncbi:MAG: DUF3592 domain-containing protein [Bacteroidetes bacterium]|nr:DUF3592 domain-containing protein [Bacteroidota bacterium]
MKNKRTFDNRGLKTTILQSLTLLSIICLTACALGGLQKGWTMLSGTRSTGIVTGYRTMNGSKPGAPISYAVVLEYKDAAGVTQIYESDIYAAPAWYQMGETVPLWYHNDRVLLQHLSAWTNTILWGVFGLFFVVARWGAKRSLNAGSVPKPY